MQNTARGVGIAALSILLVATGMGISSATGRSQGHAQDRPPHGAKFSPTTHVSRASTPLAPLPEEQTFVPIASCRLFRATVSKKQKRVQVTGTGSLASQGGAKTGCGIPSEASSVAINVTAAHAHAAGSAQVYAVAGKPATVLHFAKSAAISNGISVPIASGAGPNLAVKATTSTHLSMDVTGYYTAQIQAYVRLSVTPPYLYSATDRVVSVANPAVGQAVLTFDRTVEQCSVQAMPASDNEYASGYTVGNEAIITTWYLDASSHAEVRANVDFNLTVTC